VGPNYEHLAPGACTWNPFNFPDKPVEPGVLLIDLAAQAQPYDGNMTRQIDTTINAAVYFPDTLTIRRYMAGSDHLWVFYVDDQTNVSSSFMAIADRSKGPTMVTFSGPAQPSATFAELRCRGGPGMSFHRGASAGENRVNMTVAYQVASSEAGVESRGLTPGSCAWVHRAGLDREPYGMHFTTAANAQIAQARTGGAVDKSATAAERFPDANTIPDYMVDPRHYWSFQVALADPTVAKSHAPWIAFAGIGERTAATPQTRSNPQTVGNRERTAGTSTNVAITDPGLVFLEMVRQPKLYWMRFSARANSSPTVEFGNAPPVRINGRLTFTKATALTVSQRPPQNFSAEFVTAPLSLPPGGGKYYFVINVPKGPEGQQAREYSGEFKTMTRTVVARFTRIDVLNDSDKDSDGELAFRYYLAPAPNRLPECGQSERCWEATPSSGVHHWGSGSNNPISISLNISNVPDLVRVWVTGADDDGLGGDAGRVTDAAWGDRGSSSRNADRNTASGEFNISTYVQGQSYPFKLRSVDGSVFMFEVRGEIIIGWQ
jgi:hypothetical protein